MKIEKGTIIEGFEFIPSISLSWVTYMKNHRTKQRFVTKRHYFLQFAWLFWYINFSSKKINEL